MPQNDAPEIDSTQNASKLVLPQNVAKLAPKKGREILQSSQNVAIESKRLDGRGHRSKGIAAKIADETGASGGKLRHLM